MIDMRMMYRLGHLSPESKKKALKELEKCYGVSEKLEYLADVNARFFNEDGTFFKISP